MALTRSQLSFIKESLKWTRIRFEEYEHYPDEESRKIRLAEVDMVMDAVRQAIKDC